jgi:N-acetylmuramoyl-L-alanine amidase
MQPKIALIVGHSKVHPGSRATKPIDKMEYDWNSELALDLWREAKEIGFDAKIYLRDGLDIRAVGDMVSKWVGTDGVAIELHCNSFDGKASGTETLYDSEPKDSEEFAATVHRYVLRALERTKKQDRGIKLRSTKDEDKSNDRGAINLEHVKCTSCLVEPCFWDNPKEAAILSRNRQDYIRALISAVAEWLLKSSK